MFEGIKNIFRRKSLRVFSSKEPTGITPLQNLHSAVTFIDVEDTSFDECKQAIISFYREYNIKGDIFFFDFRKLGEGERLITSIKTTVLTKDLNWYGRPSKEKINLMLNNKPDLFISLINSSFFPIEFMAKCSMAKFKIGRIQLPGDTFDLVIKDSADRQYSEAEIFERIKDYLNIIK